jgi:hypothetical protein
MDLKLEDFDKQSVQSLTLKEFDEKSDQSLKLEDFDENSKKNISPENFEKKPEEIISFEKLETKQEKNLVIGSVDWKSEKENREEIKKLRRKGSPLWGFLWRFFSCCVLINFSIWAYFHFVKGISVLEGFSQLRNDIQTKINKPSDQIGKLPLGLKTILPYEKEKRERIAQEKIDQLNRKRLQEEVNQTAGDAMEKKRTTKPAVIYSWINEKGVRVFSTNGFPKSESYTEPKVEWK